MNICSEAHIRGSVLHSTHISKPVVGVASHRVGRVGSRRPSSLPPLIPVIAKKSTWSVLSDALLRVYSFQHAMLRICDAGQLSALPGGDPHLRSPSGGDPRITGFTAHRRLGGE